MATSSTEMMPKPAFGTEVCALLFSPCSCSSSTRFFASAFSLSACTHNDHVQVSNAAEMPYATSRTSSWTAMLIPLGHRPVRHPVMMKHLHPFLTDATAHDKSCGCQQQRRACAHTRWS